MSYRIKQRIFSGVVCEQEVYSVPSRRRKTNRTSVPKPRFQSEEEYQKYKEGIARRKCIRLVNENFAPGDIYSTLTFDSENEIHTWKEARMIRDRYWRRIKYAYPDAVIMIFMGRGKTTNRIHFHMLSHGVPEEAIRWQWITYGAVIDTRALREHNYYNGIDYGADFTALANYLFNHWTPEQGGHHYKISRNAKKPKKEEPKEAILSYSLAHPPRAPKGYAYVEGFQTEYGYLHFKYVQIPEKDPKQRSRGDLLQSPCIYEKFCNEEGQEGQRRAMIDPPSRRRR